MNACPLTSRERVNRMFERRDHDRVPRHDQYWPETVTRWQAEGLAGGAAEMLEALGSDLAGIGWSWPAPYREETVIEENETTLVKRDRFGRLGRWWKGRSGTPEHLGFECETRSIWEEKLKPMFLAGGPDNDPGALRKTWRGARERGKWVHLTGVEPFELLRAMLGDETMAIAMASEPDWIVDIAVTFTDRALAEYQRCLDAGMDFDGLWTYGDMAYNHGTFCSPKMYRELIWPQHKRLADFAHENGMRLIYHTDGNVENVIPLWIEAGFDCFQPIEAKAGMDIRELGPRYGDRLAMFGNIDATVLATGDRARIEAEVSSKLAAGMATRGYMYHSDHSVPPSVSLETYRFLIELLDKYGTYESVHRLSAARTTAPPPGPSP